MRNWLGLVSITVLLQIGLSQAPPSGLSVGFRYDESRVISYIAQMEDPVKITMEDLKSIRESITRDSACGYHLALSAERLRTFRPIEGAVPRIGQQITVFLGGNITVTGAVESYVEEWQGAPNVTVALIARVQAKDQVRFQNTKPGYFLVSIQAKPVPPRTIADPMTGVQFKTSEVLNRFGTFGNLIERTAEAGRDIRLFRLNQGSLQATDVAEGCSD